jgi:hypothetical protein
VTLVKPSVTSLLYLSIYILLLVTVDMTFLYILYMFSIILFIVYFDYMPSIVRMSLYSNTRSYSAHSLTSSVSGQHRVSMDLRCCLPVNAPYILGHVVDRTSDTPVESFVDPLPEYRTSRT